VTYLSFCLAALLCCAATRTAAGVEIPSGRHVVSFNLDWKFHKGDVEGAAQPAFDDSTWRKLDLPHDWSVEEPFCKDWASGTGYLPGGTGWYRKTFEVSAGETGRTVLVYFDGIYCNSDVWINGHHLGTRPNGYISFHYDMTPYLNIGGSNVIAVRVDHAKYADSRWYTGSGIYRDVSLISTSRIHVAPWGLFVTTPRVSADEAVVRVTTSLQNETDTAADVLLEHRLLYQGQDVGCVAGNLRLGASGTGSLTQEITVPSPKLWSVDTPHLYEVQTFLRRGENVLDNQTTRIGIRTLRFDPNEGFSLNGENMKWKGVCLHHDAGVLGAAIPKKVWALRLDRLKEMGCNAIRMSHNPHSTNLYDLCDEKGFLVVDEVFDEWELPKRKWVAGWNQGEPSHDGYAEHFEQWERRDLADVVRKNRNHPSIIMWSIGNEVDYPNDPYTHPILDTEANPQTYAKFSEDLPHADRLGQVARELAAVVKAHDTTRPVTAGLASALVSNETGYAAALDVVGYNYQEFRYARDHAKYPDRPLYGSENGMSLDGWRAVADNDYVMGQFLWTGIEYLGEAGRWPRRSSTSGAIDLANNGKTEYFIHKSLWNDAPMVYIGTSRIGQGDGNTSLWRHRRADPHWNWTENDTVRVSAYTNGDSVELFLNGTSLGVRRKEDAKDGVMHWDVQFAAGELRAVARAGKREVASCVLKTAGPTSRIVASGDTATLTADRQDVAIIDLMIADDAGTRVYHADNEITCRVSGPLRFLGMENANPSNVRLYKAPSQHAWHGRMTVYVQALDEAGEGVIEFTGTGLKKAAVVLKVVDE